WRGAGFSEAIAFTSAGFSSSSSATRFRCCGVCSEVLVLPGSFLSPPLALQATRQTRPSTNTVDTANLIANMLRSFPWGINPNLNDMQLGLIAPELNMKFRSGFPVPSKKVKAETLGFRTTCQRQFDTKDTSVA